MKPVASLTDDELLALARRAAEMPDAPAEWQRAAIALWAKREARASLAAKVADGAHKVVRGIVAVLSFDSWAVPATALGVRGAGASDIRHLLFSAEGRDIDLRVLPQSDRFAIEGQVLGPDETGQVELSALSGGAEPRTVELDALGEFRLDGLDVGTWQLKLNAGGDEILLPPIDVGARPV